MLYFPYLFSNFLYIHTYRNYSTDIIHENSTFSRHFPFLFIYFVDKTVYKLRWNINRNEIPACIFNKSCLLFSFSSRSITREKNLIIFSTRLRFFFYNNEIVLKKIMLSVFMGKGDTACSANHTYYIILILN